MIWVEGITKFYQTNRGRHYVLRDTSFYIPPLAKVGVVGRNGAGKSTLVRLLSGVDVPNQGKIIRQGLISWPLGLATGLQAAMTGRENARFACRIQGLSFSEMPPVLDFIQSFSDIGRYFDEPVRFYSSGMRARLNFGIAMAFDFDCYIIDELSAVGDEAFKEKSKRVFEEKRNKASFIMVSHGLSQLQNECESGLLLHDCGAQYFESIEEAIGRYRALVGVEADEDGRRKRRKRRKLAEEPVLAAGDAERAAPKRRRSRRRAQAAVSAEAALSQEAETPEVDPKPRRRQRKPSPVALVKLNAKSSRRGRRAGAPEPQEAKALGAPSTVPSKKAPVPVGRAPFAPRIPREIPVRAPSSEPAGAAEGSLTSERLMTLLRGGSVRR